MKRAESFPFCDNDVELYLKKSRKGFDGRLDFLSLSTNGTKTLIKINQLFTLESLLESRSGKHVQRDQNRDEANVKGKKASLPNTSLLSPLQSSRQRIKESNFVKRVSLSASNNCHWRAKKIIISWILIRNYELSSFNAQQAAATRFLCGIFISFSLVSFYAVDIFSVACVIAGSVIKLCTVRKVALRENDSAWTELWLTRTLAGRHEIRNDEQLFV